MRKNHPVRIEEAAMNVPANRAISNRAMNVLTSTNVLSRTFAQSRHRAKIQMADTSARAKLDSERSLQAMFEIFGPAERIFGIWP